MTARLTTRFVATLALSLGALGAGCYNPSLSQMPFLCAPTAPADGHADCPDGYYCDRSNSLKNCVDCPTCAPSGAPAVKRCFCVYGSDPSQQPETAIPASLSEPVPGQVPSLVPGAAVVEGAVRAAEPQAQPQAPGIASPSASPERQAR